MERGARQGAPATNNTENAITDPVAMRVGIWDELPKLALETRLAGVLVNAGLARRLAWQECEFVLDAVNYHDEREAARWRTQQRLIAEAGAA
ncbi:MAG TPA: hypothetical protein VGA47_00510 [Candidatus Dormibacteraeota bacterium]